MSGLKLRRKNMKIVNPPTPQGAQAGIRVNIDLPELRALVAKNFKTITLCAKAIGIDKSHLSHILRGEQSLTPATYDKLRRMFPTLRGERYFA